MDSSLVESGRIIYVDVKRRSSSLLLTMLGRVTRVTSCVFSAERRIRVRFR